MPCADPPELLPALLDRYERPLVRYALSIVGDLDAARDVVQETFIRFAQRDEPLSKTSNSNAAVLLPEQLEDAAPWLFTVCRNRALDVRRKQSRIIYMDQTADTTSDEPGPVATLESRETFGSLLRLLDELPENQREVIRLKFQNDLSYKEIADVTQLSVTNVGFLLHTGLKKLRALVEAAPRDEWPIRQTV
jgi:RNA polymerase sigma-70 factor (ECF subfamily)